MSSRSNASPACSCLIASPHALALTKAGQHLLPAVVKSFDRLEYALDDIRNEGAPVQRTLRVQMPPSFAVQLAVPILRDFRRASTEVDIDLISPYGVGPPLGDVDVAVVYSRPTVTDLVTDLLWPVRLNILCHPQIAAAARRQGPGRLHRGERDRARAHRGSAAAPRLVAVRAPATASPASTSSAGWCSIPRCWPCSTPSAGRASCWCDTNLFAEEMRTGAAGAAVRCHPR